MGFNPSKEKDLKRLSEAHLHSFDQLGDFRDAREKFVRQWVGSHYGSNGSSSRVPVNLIDLLVNVYTVNLVANHPRVLVTSPEHPRKLGVEAARLELATDQALRELRMHQLLQRWVPDALFGIGIATTGIRYAGQIDLEDGGEPIPLTSPYLSRISLDDWNHDTLAKHIEEVAFCGHRERVPLEVIMEAPEFDSKVKDKLKARTRAMGESRVEDMSHGQQHESEFQDYVEIWNMYVPSENMQLVMPEDFELGALQVKDFEGPEEGPYTFLNYGEVPDNIMPRSPVSVMYDLHMLNNQLFNKLADQARRQKEIYVFPGAGSNTDDGEKITKARDGEGVPIGAQTGQSISIGGPHAPNQAFHLMVKDLFAYLGGNLDALGGLSPQADTLGQDQLLQANASNRMAYLQSKTVDFVEEITRKIMWYEWTDPIRERTLSHVGPGDVPISITWSEETRSGDFLDFNFQVDPYSMQHRSPDQKLRTTIEVLQNIILPQQQQLAQQGIAIDYRELMETIQNLSGITEFSDILIYSGEDLDATQGPAGTPPQSTGAQTSAKEYVHKRVTGASRHGRDAAMQQTLMGAGVQDGEMAALNQQGMG